MLSTDEYKVKRENHYDYRNSILLGLSHQLANKLASIPVRGSLLAGQIIGRLLTMKVKSPTIIKTRYEFDMLVSPHVDRGIDRTLFLTGTTERGTLHVMQRFFTVYPKSVVFDVGANIGLMSLFSSTFLPSGKVFAFEPVKEAFRRLVFNITLNSSNNIRAFNCALGAEEAHLNIYVNSSHLGMSTFLQWEGGESSQEVEIRTIDSVVNEYDLAVDFLKIDVEGWEAEVLKGASNLLREKNAPALMLEYCEGRPMPHGNGRDLWNLVKNINDYRIFILKSGEYRIGKLSEIKNYEALPDFANLFCFLPCHLEHMPADLFV